MTEYTVHFAILVLIGGIFGGMLAYSLELGVPGYLVLSPALGFLGFLSGVIALQLPPPRRN